MDVKVFKGTFGNPIFEYHAKKRLWTIRLSMMSNTGYWYDYQLEMLQWLLDEMSPRGRLLFQNTSILELEKKLKRIVKDDPDEW